MSFEGLTKNEQMAFDEATRIIIQRVDANVLSAIAIFQNMSLKQILATVPEKERTNEAWVRGYRAAAAYIESVAEDMRQGHV